MDTVTRDSTNGDRFNVKAGTSEVLTAALSLTTYGTPTTAAPLVIQGYTSAAGDGGRGVIDGAGTYTILSGSALVHWFDMRLTNTGSADVVTAGSNAIIARCEIDTTTGGGIGMNSGAKIIDCYIHDYATTNTNNKRGISTGDRAFVRGCYIVSAAAGHNSTNAGILVNGANSCIIGNIVSVVSSHGIHGSSGCDNSVIEGNSVFGGGSTQTGIQLDSGAESVTVFNNIVEGFYGAGGDGLVAVSIMGAYGHNAYYNNTTNATVAGIAVDLGNNDTLGASPFVNAAGGDFNINGTVTGVTEDAWPQSWPGLTTSTAPKPDKGAVQAGAGAGGGGLAASIFGGGVVR